MKTFLQCILVIGFLLNPVSAHAGWVSGGGELLKDGSNPWFLYNTERVTYCIASDPTALSIRVDELPRLIREALFFWQEEFGRAIDISNSPLPPDQTPIPPEQLRLATQEFVLVECSRDPDITFQFATLNPDQLDYIDRLGRQPSDFVGMAVRTSYDEVNLRGKGFIYLSSDVIDHPFYPSADSAALDFWSRFGGVALRSVLMHELGHVFGLPHDIDRYANYWSIMDERFPEDAIWDPDRVSRSAAMPRTLAWSSVELYSNCWQRPDVFDLFDAPADTTCIGLSPSDNGLTIWGKNRAGAIVDLGELELKFERTDFINVAKVWLPAGQTVFQAERVDIISPRFKTTMLMNYNSSDGTQEFQILGRGDPECLILTILQSDRNIWYPLTTEPHAGRSHPNCGRG